MKPTRKTQPFRVGPRMPGASLTAMTRGRTFGGMNSQDAKRAAFLVDAGKRKGRAVRKPRVHRKPRG